MTESEWLACDDSPLMLSYLRGRASRRKLWLADCAACRRFSNLLHPHSVAAIGVAERLADEVAMAGEVGKALHRAEAAYLKAYARQFGGAREVSGFEWVMRGGEVHRVPGGFYGGAVSAASNVVALLDMDRRGDGEWIATAAYPVPCSDWNEGMPLVRAEHAWQADMLREVFGNPFRPVAGHHLRLTPDVTHTARAAYTERMLPSGEMDPARLTVLSDALEESGCTDNAILSHLRFPGPHVRGCWALEAIILFRRCPLFRLWSLPHLGIRVRDQDALLAAAPGWVAWRRFGLPEGMLFAVSDARLSMSVRRMAEEISARYGVPIGVGPGIGGERSPEG